MSAKNKRIRAAPRQRVHANAAGIDVGSAEPGGDNALPKWQIDAGTHKL